MKFDRVDIPEMERQRAKAIKESGKYIELTVLIGSKTHKEGDYNVSMPVVNTVVHKVGSEEIAFMYSTLKAIVEQYREQYPLECLYADVAMNCKGTGSYKVEIDPNKDKEE